MKYTLLFLLLIFNVSILNAQTSLEWVNVITGQVGGDAEVRDIEVDLSGNVYIIGGFRGNYDFDPGPGTNIITGVWSDIFIQKYTSTGLLIWTKTIHGTSNNVPYELELDVSGNLYIVGQFGTTVDFDPGAGTTSVTSVGDLDGFVLKLSSSGNFQWVKIIGGSQNQLPTGFERDGSGNLIISGYSLGTTDFDPGAGVVSRTSAGQGDAFVLKLDWNGNYVWVATMGSTAQDNALSVTVDGSDNIYALGEFSGTVDFDPGGATFNLTSAPSDDLFILKLNSSGVFQWVKQIGDGLPIFAQDIERQSNGIYVTGRYNTTIDFDPGLGIANLTPIGNYDVFLVKLDLNGNYQWAHSFGGVFTDVAYDLDAPTSGGIFVAGLFQNTVDFDPGAGTDIRTSNGSSEIFISKFDASGNHQWVTTLGGANAEWALDVKVDNSGFIYAGGEYQSAPMDFDPGSGSTMHSAGGLFDPYFLKLRECLTTTGTDTRNECAPFTWTNGVDYNVNNNSAMDTLVNAEGCDSIVTLDLTIISPTTGVDTRTECSPYLWTNGVSYTSNNNTAMDTLMNVAGCDSIVTLDLTITGPSKTMTWD